jgi:hypothetical protein
MQRRHYVLVGIILLLLIVNLFRNRKPHPAPEKAVNVTLGPSGDSSDTAAVWPAYDHAASLRDADSNTFQTALTALKAATAAVPNANLITNAHVLADAKGCTTWLLFYRQPGWKQRAASHVDNCVRDHRDEAQ